MRAVELRGPGLSSLQMVERPAPVPGPGEVAVRVRAASLNYRDLALADGSYARVERPVVLGSDGAGEVAALGPGVRTVEVGQRVVAHYVVDWISGDPDAEVVKRRLGFPLDGTLAELVVVPAHALVALPDEVSFEAAATLPIAGTTAWHALFDFGRLQPGETVVVQGSGGVSALALRFARLAGARTLAIARSADGAARARSLGAHETVDTSTTPDWPAEVLRRTSGRGADQVLDVVGGPGVADSIRASRVAGKVSLVGFVAGKQASFDLTAAFQRRVDLRAISVGPRAALEAAVRALALHRLEVPIEEVLPFERALEGFQLLARGGRRGKLVVRVG